MMLYKRPNRTEYIELDSFNFSYKGWSYKFHGDNCTLLTILDVNDLYSPHTYNLNEIAIHECRILDKENVFLIPKPNDSLFKAICFVQNNVIDLVYQNGQVLVMHNMYGVSIYSTYKIEEAILNAL